MMSERQELRRYFRRLRRALSAAEQQAHARAVAQHFFTSGLALRAHTVGAYFAADGELDTAPLLQRLLHPHRRVAMPVVRKGRVLEFYRHRRIRPMRVWMFRPSRRF